MVRKILALLAGLFIFFLVTTLIQFISGLMYGMPNPEIIGNIDRMNEYVAQMPAGAFTLLLLSYVVGSFASGFLMRMISRWDSLVLPLIVGTLGTVGWIFNIGQIQHPMWVVVIGFLCYIPFTILGHRAAAGTAR